MSSPLRLLCVLAHPDDETLGCGGILAKYAAEGIETHVATATRGERGRIGTERLGAELTAPVRERELRAACDALGVHALHLLGWMDGEVDRVPAAEAISKLAAVVRTVRPHVVVTFGADGSYGHIDHIAISQWTSAALVAAADGAFVAAPGIELPAAPWSVAKLYWMAETAAVWAAYQDVFGEVVYRVDGGERRPLAWPDWQVTTRIDTRAQNATLWRAVDCHRSQTSGYARFAEIGERERARLWNEQTFYRIHSLVNGGRALESDLFEGLR